MESRPRKISQLEIQKTYYVSLQTLSIMQWVWTCVDFSLFSTKNSFTIFVCISFKSTMRFNRIELRTRPNFESGKSSNPSSKTWSLKLQQHQQKQRQACQLCSQTHPLLSQNPNHGMEYSLLSSFSHFYKTRDWGVVFFMVGLC